MLIFPETGARHLTFIYIRYERGAEFPQHHHDASEDVLFVLEGSGGSNRPVTLDVAKPT